MALSDVSGKKLSVKYDAYLKLDYDSTGKLMRLEVPNIVTVLPNTAKSPVLSMIKGKICTLPLSKISLEHLYEITKANGGEIIITSPEEYSLHCLGLDLNKYSLDCAN